MTTPIEALRELVRLEDLRLRAGAISPVEPGFEKDILMDEWRKGNRAAWGNARAALAQADAVDKQYLTTEQPELQPESRQESLFAGMIAQLPGLAEELKEIAQPAAEPADERAAFEAWLIEVHMLDATWNMRRNCYDDFPCHLAWKAWQAARAQPAAEPVQEPWRDHVEQRLLTWRQRFMNKSGDQLALDDFMDKESLDDLIDFVCDEWAQPAAEPTGEAIRLEGYSCAKCGCVDMVKNDASSQPADGYDKERHAQEWRALESGEAKP